MALNFACAKSAQKSSCSPANAKAQPSKLSSVACLTMQAKRKCYLKSRGPWKSNPANSRTGSPLLKYTYIALQARVSDSLGRRQLSSLFRRGIQALPDQLRQLRWKRSEERRVGKECRS